VKIRIITMEDPLYTLDFIRDIVRARHRDISGITIARGGRMTISSKKSHLVYLAALILIMGPVFFVQNTFKTLRYAIHKKASRLLSVIPSPGIESEASLYGIPVDYTSDPNSEEYIRKVKEEKPDVIINQSQSIIKKPLLDTSRIGMVNRHNALLPRNRGRLTPFWVLYKGEHETGVSIHLLDEGIDSGPLLVQKRFPVSSQDTFRSIVEKNYSLASVAMLEALEMLENGSYSFLEKDSGEGSYNTIPTLKEAWEFRKSRIRQGFSWQKVRKNRSVQP